MKVLGLDIAQTTGYAVLLDPHTIESYGFIKIKLSGDPDVDKSEFKKFRKELLALIDKHKPDIVVLESIFVGQNPKVSARLNQQRGITIETVPMETKLLGGQLTRVRMNVLGKGKRHDKKEVFKWAIGKYKLKDFKFSKDNDITDAILLSYWAYIQ